MKKYLVTGGAGFIGANFVKFILNKWGSDIDVTIFDALTYAGNLESIKNELALPNVRFVKGNICDEQAVNRVMNEIDPDFVVNFAAESHVDRSIENPRSFIETNVLGTHTLLEAARRSWLCGKTEDGKPRYRDGKKFLQISTDEVYVWPQGARTSRLSEKNFSRNPPPLHHAPPILHPKQAPICSRRLTAKPSDCR